MIKNLRKILIIARYEIHLIGDNTIGSLFWPYFRLYSPVIVGILTFGQIERIDSFKVSYLQYSLSGLVIMLFLIALLTSSSKHTALLSRRNRLPDINFNYNIKILGSTSVYFPIIFIILNVLLFNNVFRLGIWMGTLNYIISVLFLLSILPFFYFISFVYGVLIVLAKDFKYLLGFVNMFLLFYFPVFHETKPIKGPFQIDFISQIISSFRIILFQGALSKEMMFLPIILSILSTTLLVFFQQTILKLTLTIFSRGKNHYDEFDD